MPPHIFHALADDPARQFGCMAALFHLFDHHPRFSPRKRSMSPTFPSEAHKSMLPSPAIAANSAQAQANSTSKEYCRNVSSKDGKKHSPASRYNSHAKLKKIPEKGSNYHKRCASLLDSPTVSTTPSASSEKTVSPSSSDKLNESPSPSILSSSRTTNYILRESPQKCRQAYERAKSPAANDRDSGGNVNSYASSNMESRSSPSSPHMPLAQALKEARRSPARSTVCKSLFVDKPGAAATEVQYADLESRRYRSTARPRRRISEDNPNIAAKVCKDQPPSAPSVLNGIQESVKALQQFVNDFDAQLVQQNDKSAKRNNIRSSSWWSNARSKSRLFKTAKHQLSTVSQKYKSNAMDDANIVEAPAAARTSSFDYNEAVRISQKIEETPARLSLDGRELVPKAVMKLREAMRLGHIHINNAELLTKLDSSVTASNEKSMTSAASRSAVAVRNMKEESGSCVKQNGNVSVAQQGFNRSHHSNVIARLMGLDSLSSPSREHSDGGSAESKACHPEESSLLFRDLINRCPQRLKLDQPGNIRSRSRTCVAAEQMREHDIVASTPTSVSKIEASNIASVKHDSSAFMPDYSNLKLAEAAGDLIIKQQPASCKSIAGEAQTNERIPANRGNIDKHASKSLMKAAQRRHAKVEVMPNSSTSIPNHLSSRLESMGSRRGRGTGRAVRDKVCNWEEEDIEVKHLAAYTKNHVPCSIVVMEPRRSSVRTTLTVDEFTVKTEKGIPGKLSSIEALSNESRSADTGHEYITLEAAANASYMSFKTDTASSNLYIGSRKGETSPNKQQAGNIAQYDKRIKGAQNYKQLAAIPKPDMYSCPQPSPKAVTSKQHTACVAKAPQKLISPAGGSNNVDRIKQGAASACNQLKHAEDPKMVPSRMSCLVNVAAAGRPNIHCGLKMSGIEIASKHNFDRKKSWNSGGGERITNERKWTESAGRQAAGDRKANVRDEGNSGGVLKEAKLMDERSRHFFEKKLAMSELPTFSAPLQECGKIDEKETAEVARAMEHIMRRADRIAAAGESGMAAPAAREQFVGDRSPRLLGSEGIPVRPWLPATSSSCKKIINTHEDLTADQRHARSACNAQRPLHSPRAALISNEAKEEYFSGERISQWLLANRIPLVNLFSFPTLVSNNKHLVCCSPLEQIYLNKEQNDEAMNCWTYHTFVAITPIFHSIISSLEDSIFDDLLCEIF